MTVDARLLRRFLREVTGPDDVVKPIADFVLDHLTQLERHRERAFLLRTALELIPEDAAPWTKARVLRDLMIAAQLTPVGPNEPALRSTIRAVLKICRKPLTTTQLFRVITHKDFEECRATDSGMSASSRENTAPTKQHGHTEEDDT